MNPSREQKKRRVRIGRYREECIIARGFSTAAEHIKAAHDIVTTCLRDWKVSNKVHAVQEALSFFSCFALFATP